MVLPNRGRVIDLFSYANDNIGIESLHVLFASSAHDPDRLGSIPAFLFSLIRWIAPDGEWYSLFTVGAPVAEPNP